MPSGNGAQGALFDVPGETRRKGRCAEHGKVLPHFRCAESERWLDARGFSPGPDFEDGRPWDVLSPEDERLGWEYTYVDPRRAVEIRKEIEVRHGHG